MRTKSTGQRAHTHFLSQASAGANVDIDRRAFASVLSVRPENASVHVNGRGRFWLRWKIRNQGTPPDSESQWSSQSLDQCPTSITLA